MSEVRREEILRVLERSFGDRVKRGPIRVEASAGALLVFSICGSFL